VTRDQPPETVVHALLESAERDPQRQAFRVIERSGDEFELSNAELARLIGQAVAGLAAQGIGEGDRVAVVLPTSREFLAIYLGCLYAGVVPIVAAEPMDARTEHYANNLDRIAAHCQAVGVITAPETEGLIGPLLRTRVLSSDALRKEAVELDAPRARPEATAHLQATSGSTGSPKLAIVRHSNIVANVRGIARAIAGNRDDTLVSWLPLFHDMGLIGISYALTAQIPMVIGDPVNFLRSPLAWLQWISRYHGTLSPAPNAAFHMCARVAKRRPPEDLDLSAWRVALCGAEPVQEATMREFQAAFGPFGLPATTLRPVYGLAESTLATTVSDIARPYSVDRVDAEAVAVGGRAEPRSAEDHRAAGMMCVGRVLPGHDLRIVDADGAPLQDRMIGEIEVSGPSVIEGYLPAPDDGDPGAPDDELKRPDGYLRTGDLGYLVDGELYVTGRHKDIVIIAGRNYVPNQLERFVETVVDSPRPAAVVAVGVVDPALQTEQLHLLLDQRLAEHGDRQAVTARVRDALAEVFGIGGVTLHWVNRSEIPRTTSGKVQRHRCRRMIEERAFGQTG
jgi:fatty-acyl-CoA synthase